jgi:D-xylose reductase
MEELVDAGYVSSLTLTYASSPSTHLYASFSLTKNIGVSNFSSGLINDLLRTARYKPQVLQVEIHPYLTQLPLLNYAKTVGIHVTAYSSFGPASWVELNMAQNAPPLLENPTIVEIAKKKNKVRTTIDHLDT